VIASNLPKDINQGQIYGQLVSKEVIKNLEEVKIMKPTSGVIRTNRCLFSNLTAEGKSWCP
jgi:hypothetical protein